MNKLNKKKGEISLKKVAHVLPFLGGNVNNVNDTTTHKLEFK